LYDIITAAIHIKFVIDVVEAKCWFWWKCFGLKFNRRSGLFYDLAYRRVADLAIFTNAPPT